jgi:protein phosphatase-4 regulatory subunit 3
METEVDAREPVATPSAAVSAAPDIEENVEIGPSASDLAVESDEDAAEAVINGSNGHGDEAEDAIRIESRQEDESAELVVQEDGKRVKVYELRDQSWHDRGTGQCKGIYDDSQDLALLVVEAEDVGGDKDQGGFLKEELLLSAKVERADIYARQQGQPFRFAEYRGVLTDRYADRVDRAERTRYRSQLSRCRGMRGYLAVHLRSPAPPK